MAVKKIALREPNISSDVQAVAIRQEAKSKPIAKPEAGMLRRFAVFLTIFQSVLFLAHYLVYKTLVVGFAPLSLTATRILAAAFAILSIAFLIASLVGFRNYGPMIRIFYTTAAIWLGTFSFLFYAAAAWWLIYAVTAIAGVSFAARTLAIILFGSALAISLYGVINAQWTRVKRITVHLTGLPPTWRGRTIALLSDLHLGNVRNTGFAKRIVCLVNGEKPDLVIIAGDLFDGTAIDADKATAPLRDLNPPFGTFFSEGNHEEFGDPRPLLAAITKAGVRILNKEKVDLDGLQLLGVPYRDATQTEHLRSVLAAMNIDTARASVLICHAPDRPAVVEEAGISLQLSGHTHGGQFIPYSWIATRMYRQFVHGLSRLGNLHVYTSYGVGTWGPPLRVGTYPEIVMIRVE
jgi:predicted MPP superfamily phosphohydrolase